MAADSAATPASPAPPASFWVDKLEYCAMAKCAPPDAVIAMIKRKQFAGQPQAIANLEHYLDGTGTDLPQNMVGLLAVDGVQKKLVALINAAKPATDIPLVMTDPITQGDYGGADEWKDALGNIDQLTVTILGDVTSLAANASGATAIINVELKDPYQWHPGDARVTQCIHEFFEAMKATRHAAEYMAIGTGKIPVAIDPSLIPRSAGASTSDGGSTGGAGSGSAGAPPRSI